MKRFVLTLLPFAILLGISSAGAVTLSVKSGFVRYEVRLKTLGISSDDVSAVNRKVIGKLLFGDDGRVEGGLIVPVAGFDSNNTKRDKDVANILRYKEHPAITFEVVAVSVEDISRVLQSDSGKVSLRAKITAAGGSKVYDVVLDFHRAGSNLIRFTTFIDAKFSDFGIDPPKFGLFLKTAPDRLGLRGDLVLEAESEAEREVQERP